MPLAIDHFGHVCVEDCIRFARRMEPYNLAWLEDMVTGINNPIFENGFIKVPEKPGIGFDELNEEVIKEHINPQIPGYFEPTDEWNKEFSNDRIWS